MFTVPVPPLDELYLVDDDVEIRWKLLAWIFSFNNDSITVVKAVPKEFLLISTTLFVLVKVKKNFKKNPQKNIVI